jgi:hypothetical protein
MVPAEHTCFINYEPTGTVRYGTVLQLISYGYVRYLEGLGFGLAKTLTSHENVVLRNCLTIQPRVVKILQNCRGWFGSFNSIHETHRNINKLPFWMGLMNWIVLSTKIMLKCRKKEYHLLYSRLVLRKLMTRREPKQDRRRPRVRYAR